MIDPLLQVGKQDSSVILPYLLGDGGEGNELKWQPGDSPGGTGGMRSTRLAGGFS